MRDEENKNALYPGATAQNRHTKKNAEEFAGLVNAYEGDEDEIKKACYVSNVKDGMMRRR